MAGMDLDLDPPVIVIQEPLERQTLLTSAYCLTSEEEVTAADDETSSIGSVYSPSRTYHNLRYCRIFFTTCIFNLEEYVALCAPKHFLCLLQNGCERAHAFVQ